MDVDRASSFDIAPLYVAAEDGRLEIICLLLEADRRKVNMSKQTPLYIAFYKGHIEVVQMQLESSANNRAELNVPKVAAWFCGHWAIVRLLLQAKAPPISGFQ